MRVAARRLDIRGTANFGWSDDSHVCRSMAWGGRLLAYIRGYNLTNANIGYRFADGLEVIIWARNLLDADYIQNLTIQAGNSGLILGSPSDPRTIGGTVRFRI
ncbi:TonB-dependent receptor [Sphingomonas aurantiaca]